MTKSQGGYKESYHKLANMTISTAKICYLRTWGTDKPFPGQAARQWHNLRLTDGTNGAVCARANKRCVHMIALLPKETDRQTFETFEQTKA